MTVLDNTLFDFDNTYAAELAELVIDWQPDEVPAPELVAVNRELAIELGVDPDELDGPGGAAILAGDAVPVGAKPVAMAYSGHQFGGFSPRLGDGRAVLLGEVVDQAGNRRDIHLKGSGRTPFSRGGDGKAGLGPMLREFLIAEALHSLGVPTTRALAVATTGEMIARQKAQAGAVLTRVAASHLRVGTFEYGARVGDPADFQGLVDYSIMRHYPQVATAESPAFEFFTAVAEKQAELIAKWMLLGFVHGVMNTDNMTISGEGIDYGPCAFMDRYDPKTVFSSIDHAGRYAYVNQPNAATWNLARLAETLVSLVDDDFDVAAEKLTAVLNDFGDRYQSHWLTGMRAKLGMMSEDDNDQALVDDLLQLLETDRVDYTMTFRTLARWLRGDQVAWASLFANGDVAAAAEWADRWRARLQVEDRDSTEAADAMDQVNPIYIPRNHLVEEVLAAADEGDLEPFEQLLTVVTDPFTERDGHERFGDPAPDEFQNGFQTFCGT